MVILFRVLLQDSIEPLGLGSFASSHLLVALQCATALQEHVPTADNSLCCRLAEMGASLDEACSFSWLLGQCILSLHVSSVREHHSTI